MNTLRNDLVNAGFQILEEQDISKNVTALDLPIGMGPVIFAIGRSAGWVAHILEQYEAGFVLRPRARWAGSADMLAE